MDRVSDEDLNTMIALESEDMLCESTMNHFILQALTELKARRDAERRPDPLSQALNEGDGTYRP